MIGSSFELSFVEKDLYHYWISTKRPKTTGLTGGPTISVVVPVYNVSSKILKECIDSVLLQKYQNVELCLADDASTLSEVRQVLDSYRDNPKVKIAYRKENGGISQATNTGLELATGEYIGFLDCDDILAGYALPRLAAYIAKHPKAEVFYSDEDHVSEDGRLLQKPHFKPDFSPDTLLGQMYICHFLVIKKSHLDKIGALRTECDGAQDFDLALRACMHAKEVVHIPETLYHWRIRSGSTAENTAAKPYVYEAAKRTQEDAIKRMGVPAYVEKLSGREWSRIVYEPGDFCILDGPVEIEGKVIVDARLIDSPRGEYLLFMGPDVEPIEQGGFNEAVKRLLGQAQQDHVGAVGAKLYGPLGSEIFSDGIISTGDGYMDALRGHDDSRDFYWDRNIMDQDVYGLRRDVMVVSKEKYLEAGGLKESGIIGDALFCKNLLDLGYYNVIRNDVVFRKTNIDTKDSEEFYGSPTPTDPFYHPLFARESGKNTYSPDYLRTDDVRRLFFWPRFIDKTVAFIEDVLENRGLIRISGWAVDTDIFSNKEFTFDLCLVAGRFKRYRVPVIRTMREDLVSVLSYKEVEESGFVCVLEKRALSPGVYKIGVISKNGIWVSEKTITV